MTADAVGGVWTYALDLSRELTSRGIQVALAVLGPAPSRAQRAEAHVIAGLQLYQHDGRLEWMEEPWHDVAAAGEWLLALAGEVRPELVHLNGYCHGTLPWDAPVLVAGHSCVCSWWRSVLREAPPARIDVYRHRVAAGLRAADVVVAPSSAMLEALQRHYGPLGRTAVIPNGRSPSNVAARKQPLVLCAGRLWDLAKNVGAVCAVAPLLPWPVIVAGDAGGADLAASGVRALGCLDSPRLARWMARASIYALPARYEPFGLSVLEAAQAGCALVLGDIPSLREVWGDAAVYVDPDDRASLAEALTRLIADDAERARLATLARCRGGPFTPARMADGYLSSYSRLLGNGGAMDERTGRAAAACSPAG